ncbi:D-alanyl-D-alanine carboxypeptidase [Streptomyces sp. enrichment culture]|uniref:D-alanyl-D-alanine carboxypeptidase n=1 Tax=Streptomyces sp. enrichment culture TaxID=1795815 RepID=UPI003F54885E
MAREAEKVSARGAVDTATRVLSARTGEEPRGAERGDSDSGREASGESGESGESSGPGGTGGTGGTDGRLREAVAAWVASADDDEQRPGSEDAEGKGPADSEGSEGSEGPAEAGTSEDPAADAGHTDESTASGDRPTSKSTDEPAAAGTDAQDAGDAEDAGKRAQGGREAAGGADEPVDAREDTREPSAAPEAPEAASTGSPSRDEAEGAEESEADRSATAPRDSGTEESGPADADKTDDDKTGADKTDGGTASGTSPAPAADRTGSAAPRTPGDDAKAAATPAPKPGADADADADGPDTGTEPATGAATGTGTGKTPAPATGDAEPDKSEGTGGKGTAPVVDQPTAVFKAVRPPVDQPTTMLKLGGATKDAAGEDAGKKDVPEKGAPEKDAERTSKFVALKPLDDPAARKPAAPADATAPVPTVGPERTTQQPLPPKPPLDLLAELTNTPPPPETPLRTAVRRVKIWTPLVLLLVVVFGVVQSVRPLPAPTLELTAKDSHTFEGGEVDIPWPAKGQAALDVQGIGTFGSSGEQKPVPIASVAKVMTAYVILRDHPLKSGAEGPKIDIDQAAEDQSDAGQESTVDVTKGDKITQREALESILIASANNVARLLARWDAGSEKAFVEKMNGAAKDLGMKNTTYTDPSGLNNTTVSTAVDQVKLAKAAMEQPAFREVAAMMSYVDYKGTRHDNWNRLVGSNDVTGIKTGTTTSALGNLVFSAKKDVNGETHRIIGAVVRQPAGGPDNTILGAALYEGDRLIKAAQGALESATILKKGTVVGYADDGLGGRTPVAVTEDVTAVGWAGLSVKLTFAADDLPHTAEAGTKVGTLTVGDGSSGAVKVPVALQKDLVEPGFGAKLTRIG